MQDDVKGEGRVKIYQLDAGIRHALMHLYANMEPLHRGGEGVVVGRNHVPFVFRQHALEVLQVHKRHVHLIWLARNRAVFAFDFSHKFVYLCLQR